MSLEPLEYLRHMLDEAEYLASATAGLTREQFLTKALLTDAARGGITSEATSLARE